MCVIVIKKDTAPAPSKELLLTQFNNNPDGAGYMYVKDGSVRIHKGFMTFDDFYNSYQKTLKQIGTNHNMIFHFRISTQAGVCKEFTHPFPYTPQAEPMKWLNVKTPLGIAHNGIISLTSSYGAKDYTDTTKFINDFLTLIIRKNIYNFSTDSRVMSLIEKLINGSRLAFLDGKDKITTVGKFVHDKDSDLWFSNEGYKAPKVKKKITTIITPKLTTEQIKEKYKDLKDPIYNKFFGYPEVFCPKLDGSCGYCSHCIFKEYCKGGIK